MNSKTALCNLWGRGQSHLNIDWGFRRGTDDASSRKGCVVMGNGKGKRKTSKLPPPIRPIAYLRRLHLFRHLCLRLQRHSRGVRAGIGNKFAHFFHHYHFPLTPCWTVC